MWRFLTRLLLGVTTLSTGVWGQTVRICTYEVKPYITCSEDGQSHYGPLANIVVSKCLPNATALVAALDSCACDAGLGLFDVNAINYSITTRFVMSTPYASVRVRPETDTDDFDLWTVFSPFEPTLWLLVMITPLAVAIVMTFFSWTISKYKRKKFQWRVLPQFAFQNMLSLLNDYTHIEYLDWAGKRPYMVVLKFFLQSFLVAYAFLCLVIVSVYSAQLTNILFMRNMQPLFDQDTDMALDDLRMHAIGTRLAVPQSVESLVYGTNEPSRGTVFDLASSSVALGMVNQLWMGDYDGVVLPLEMAIWAVDETDHLCDLTVVPLGSVYATVTIASSWKCASSLGRQEYLHTFAPPWGHVASWMDTYRRASKSRWTTSCNKEVRIRISITDIAGGWVIVGFSIAVPLLLTIGRYLYYLMRKCIDEYGHLFVIKTFSSASDSGSNNNGSNATDAKRHELASKSKDTCNVHLTADDVTRLMECGYHITEKHLLRKSSPPMAT